MKNYRVTVGILAAAMLCCASFATSAPADCAKHEFETSMQPVLAGYIVVQEALAADSLERVEETATAIADAAAKLDGANLTGEHAERYRNLPATIVSASRELAKAPSIETARDALKGLSRPMAMWATMSSLAGVDVVFCPMANASWLQRAGDIKNPYYGSGMLACGEVVDGRDREK
jgi:Cu(I)/Ag(I) efflux system membrane fusion protein